MRRYLSALAVALVALSGAARIAVATGPVAQSRLAVVLGWDLDSTSMTYAAALGPSPVTSTTTIRSQAPDGEWRPSGDQRIKTAAGGATTVTSYTASSGALQFVSTGDLVQVTDEFNRPISFAVVAKASNNSVTADRTVSLAGSSGHTYVYRKFEQGTSINYGWFQVGGWSYTTVFVDVQAMTGTGGIDFQIECAPDQTLAGAQVLASSNIAAAGVFAVAIPEPWDMCRVGAKWATTDDVNDSSVISAEERINVYAIRRQF